jgi:hypothetical protein
MKRNGPPGPEPCARTAGHIVGPNRARFAAAHPDRAPRVFTASFLLDADPPIHRNIGLPVADPAKVPAAVVDMTAWKGRQERT